MELQAVTGMPQGGAAARLLQPAAHFTDVLARFEPISLAEMDSVSLLDRVDTKVVMTSSQLVRALWAVSGQYRVLTIERRRISRYQTLYYDTAGLDLYHQHHNGLGTRYKVRSRTYVESGLTFFEVKHKTNRRRTIKSRLPLPGMITAIEGPPGAFLDAHTPLHGDELQPVLWNTFSRITLVSRHHQERVTLDLNLGFSHGSAQVALPGLAIAEVKQPHFSQASDLLQQLRRLGVRPGPFSKYCMGVCLLYPDIKHNNFKRQLCLIDHIVEEELSHESIH
jgi:hypothetical protein